jgi:hypothetical protein
MMYKTTAAVCSEIRTKHSTQSKHHVEFFNIIPGGFKRVIDRDSPPQSFSTLYASKMCMYFT